MDANWARSQNLTWGVVYGSKSKAISVNHGLIYFCRYGTQTFANIPAWDLRTVDSNKGHIAMRGGLREQGRDKKCGRGEKMHLDKEGATLKKVKSLI